MVGAGFEVRSMAVGASQPVAVIGESGSFWWPCGIVGICLGSHFPHHVQRHTVSTMDLQCGPPAVTREWPGISVLGMLASSSKNERGSVQVRNEKWKKLSPAKAHAELERWVALADEVGQRAAPRTCREWIDEHVLLHNIVVKHKLRGLRSRLLCSSVVGGVGVWGCRGMRFEVFGRIAMLNVSEGF